MDTDSWFTRWESKTGEKLSNTQIPRLVALTRQWKNNNITDSLSVWASDPATEFWGFEPFCTEGPWIRECLRINLPPFRDCDEYIEDHEKVLARRRVLLIILHEITQKEIVRLRKSFQTQTKFLTAAVRNVVEQAYPGKSSKQLRDKCTHLQRYGQKYSSLERKELVLSPLRGTSSNFERAKIESIEMEALVSFAETTFNEEHQKELQKAFECIVNTCPFKPTSRLNLRLPSKSARRRLRKIAARIMDTQKPSSPLVSSQIQARITPDRMQLRHSLGFDLSGTSTNPFSSRENLVDSGNVFTQHAPNNKSMEEASEGILGMQTEARNAARIISQSALQQEMENRTQAPWNNTVVSSIPMALYPTEGQVSVPILLDSHQEQAERYQFPVYNPLDDSALASASSQFPVYNPLDDSVLASAPSQFPVYNPLDDSVLASAPSQFPVNNPLDDSVLASAPSQFPVHNPLDDSVLASAPSQFPVYNPLDDSVLASAPSQFPVYNPLDDSVLASAPSQFPVYNPLDDRPTALAPQYPVHDALFAKSSQPSSLIHPKNPVQGSMPPQPQNHDLHGVHYDYMINHMFPVTFQI